jgi:5'-AMP-activated protein kinase regulatory beta subunit
LKLFVEIGGGTTENPDEVFSQTRPELDEYTKEPPPLPPHLRHIILNKVVVHACAPLESILVVPPLKLTEYICLQVPPVNDAAALTVPQHVALNHLYW